MTTVNPNSGQAIILLPPFPAIAKQGTFLSFPKSRSQNKYPYVIPSKASTFGEAAFSIHDAGCSCFPFHLPLFKHNWMNFKKSRLLYSLPPAVFSIFCGV